MVGTPIKGSPGYKERRAAKARGEDFRATPKALKEYARKRGANLKDYQSGNKDFSLPTHVKQSTKLHNNALFEQRRGAIDLKEKMGIITSKQAEHLRSAFRDEAFYLQKLQRITEMLDFNAHTPNGRQFTNAERAKLEREYRRLTKKYDAAHRQLEKYNVVPPKGSDLEYGYYHG